MMYIILKAKEHFKAMPMCQQLKLLYKIVTRTDVMAKLDMEHMLYSGFAFLSGNVYHFLTIYSPSMAFLF